MKRAIRLIKKNNKDQVQFSFISTDVKPLQETCSHSVFICFNSFK